MVTAWVGRRLGVAVNRKRVLRVMREQRLIQRRRSVPRRRRPSFFRVERPAQLWHMDMTSIWVAEHGWVYLNAIIDCPPTSDSYCLFLGGQEASPSRKNRRRRPRPASARLKAPSTS